MLCPSRRDLNPVLPENDSMSQVNPSQFRSPLMMLLLTLTLAIYSTSTFADSPKVRSDRSGSAAVTAGQGDVEPTAETNRRRPARPNRDTSAMLTGRVLEEGSNAAVFGAVITVQGMTFTADSQGVFNITGLAAGATTVRIERWGFEATTRTLTLVAGSNALGDVSLVPRPVVTLTETDGTTHRLDFDSVEFASAAPLSNYIPLSPAEFCRLDGTVVEYDKAQIATLAGPGVEASGACCPPNDPGLQFTLTLKSGESFPAILRMCEFYKLDFIGRSRDTGQWVYRDFTKIAQIQFP